MLKTAMLALCFAVAGCASQRTATPPGTGGTYFTQFLVFEGEPSEDAPLRQGQLALQEVERLMTLLEKAEAERRALILARPAVVSHGGAAAVIALDRDRYEIMVGPGTAEYLLVLRRRGGDLEGQGYFPVNDVGGAYLHTLSTDGKAPVFALVVIKKVDSDPLPATTR